MDQQETKASHVGFARRRLLRAMGGLGLLVCSAPAFAHGPMAERQRRERMDIKRNGSRPSAKAPDAYFSGAVRVEPVFQVGDPVRFNGGSVTFAIARRSNA